MSAVAAAPASAQPPVPAQRRTVSRPNRRMPIIEIVVSAVIILLPGILPSAYFVRVLEDVAIFALLAMGLNLIFGFTGQISLGHAAFYAMGAYGSAMLETRLGLPIAVSWPLAVVIAMIIAWLISFPVLRLRGHYLALATLAIGLVTAVLIGQGGSITGGHDGIIVPAGLVLGDFLRVNLPYVVVIVAVVAYWLLRNLTNHSVGRALRALRDDPDAAASLGITVVRYRAATFVIAAALAAIAGIFYAHVAQVVTPEVFDFDTSIQILVMVIIGGMGHRLGGAVGAAIVILLPEFLYQLQGAKTLTYAVVVLFVLLFLPTGIAGLPQRILGAVRGRRARRAADATQVSS